MFAGILQQSYPDFIAPLSTMLNEAVNGIAKNEPCKNLIFTQWNMAFYDSGVKRIFYY